MDELGLGKQHLRLLKPQKEPWRQSHRQRPASLLAETRDSLHQHGRARQGIGRIERPPDLRFGQRTDPGQRPGTGFVSTVGRQRRQRGHLHRFEPVSGTRTGDDPSWHRRGDRHRGRFGRCRIPVGEPRSANAACLFPRLSGSRCRVVEDRSSVPGPRSRRRRRRGRRRSQHRGRHDGSRHHRGRSISLHGRLPIAPKLGVGQSRGPRDGRRPQHRCSDSAS
mmetsp:Transcript_20702/g.48886  ORF Transcript_20702/g.48886 Transcript_20702/m.48886 type:complete len:222 (+) Transcript_20702:1337-2002(+)